MKTSPAEYVVRARFLDQDWQKMVSGAISDPGMRLVKSIPTRHGLVSAAVLAFDLHLPLTFRPQHVWLAIAQGMAMHVETHAEELRDRLVGREGRKVLEIDVTAKALRGFEPQDWAELAGQFTAMLRGETKQGVSGLFGCDDFSGTTAAESVAACMTTMDACKSYFEYRLRTRCGFPRITLEGTLADWQLLRTKARALVTAFGMPDFASRWLATLDTVLVPMIAARAEPGNVNVEFWESMAKRGGPRGSGAPTWINGWINAFFPYSRLREINRFCVPFAGGFKYADGEAVNVQGGLEESDFPDGLCSAPVSLDKNPLEFRGGFFGVRQDADGTVSPAVGWVVACGKCPRTEGYLERCTDEAVLAKEMLTNIGARIPLLDFVNTPSALADHKTEDEITQKYLSGAAASKPAARRPLGRRIVKSGGASRSGCAISRTLADSVQAMIKSRGYSE